MTPARYPKLFDLSLSVDKLENDTYQIIASSERLNKTCIARLKQAEIDDLMTDATKLQQNQLPMQRIEDFGRRLFEALIRDQVRDMYRLLEGQNTDGLSFQLLLNLKPQILQWLPWEGMFDPYKGSFLCLREHTHIIRKVDRKSNGAGNETEPEYTNLTIAIANARGLSPITSEDEQRLIDKALLDLHDSGKINRGFIRGSETKIHESLAGFPDVFHFVGHGAIKNGVPGIYIEDDASGDAIFVDGTQLINDYFTPTAETSRHIRLVILSACQTAETPIIEGNCSLAHQLASKVDAVIAMQFPIFKENVTEFNRELYHALAEGARLEDAVNSTRRKIVSDKTQGNRDWISPVLVTYQCGPAVDQFQLISQIPFKGPIYYDTGDWEQFTGREQEFRKYKELSQGHNIVVIQGETGTGKTSFLKAGLLAKMKSSQQPVVYLSLDEKLENQLKFEINGLLNKNGCNALPEGAIENFTASFPQDLIVLLDRVEQTEHLGEQITRIVNSLIRWAKGTVTERRRTCLIMATRLDQRGAEPLFIQQQVPEGEYPRLHLDMLDYDQASDWITAITRKSAITFLPDTINRILHELRYDHPIHRNMMALQVVCRWVYLRARGYRMSVAAPGLLDPPNSIEAILEQEFKIASKLNQAIYSGGAAAHKVLSQFVSSDRQSMRPRSWNDLKLRSGLQEDELHQVLYQLENDGLLHLSQEPRGDKYELVHETLVHQVDWLSPADIELRELEEIIDSAHTVIPLKSAQGGLEKLDGRRDELILTDEQPELLLRSALEANHEIDYWFTRVLEPQQALTVLTSPYLSEEAQLRACHYLGKIGATEGLYLQTAQASLSDLATKNASPYVRQAACLSLAPLVNEQFISQAFREDHKILTDLEIEALATMFDSLYMPLKGLSAGARKRIRVKLIKINTNEILSTAVRAAALGALGFALAVVWISGQVYRSPALTGLPSLVILGLQFTLVGLLAFILALPGAFCAPLARNISTILSGGRRNLPAGLGIISGSALGIGLTVVFLAALAEYESPDLLRLIRYFVSGALIGGAVGLPWLLSIRVILIRSWLVLLAGLLGSVVFFWVSQWPGWWPENSFALALDSRYEWWVRAAPGFLIGLGNAIGLTWGHLGKRSS